VRARRDEGTWWCVPIGLGKGLRSQICSSSENISDEKRGKIVEQPFDLKAKEILNERSAFLESLIHLRNVLWIIGRYRQSD